MLTTRAPVAMGTIGMRMHAYAHRDVMQSVLMYEQRIQLSSYIYHKMCEALTNWEAG